MALAGFAGFAGLPIGPVVSLFGTIITLPAHPISYSTPVSHGTQSSISTARIVSASTLSTGAVSRVVASSRVLSSLPSGSSSGPILKTSPSGSPSSGTTVQSQSQSVISGPAPSRTAPLASSGAASTRQASTSAPQSRASTGSPIPSTLSIGTTSRSSTPSSLRPPTSVAITSRLSIPPLSNSRVASTGVESSPSASRASVKSSSRSPSSFGTASTGSRSSSPILSSSGCPPVPLTLKTRTITVPIAITTSINPTPTVYLYSSTVESIITIPGTYTYTYAYTTYGTYTTYTYYSFTVSPAQTTVTIPTPSAFTPLKCEAIYNNPTTTFTITASTTSTIISYPTPTTISTDGITTYQSFYGAQAFESGGPDYSVTSFAIPSITSTITRSDPTSTVYAACATNNVTPDFPGISGVYIAQTNPNNTITTIVPAMDPTDCCSICQSTTSCVASVYGLASIVDPTSPNYCTLYISNSTICNPTFVGAEISYYFVNATLYSSNGACGQYGQEPIYFT